ncbi:hypothetical protein BDZ91DRAFT_732758 [Kalaharituber pfeilii]|nr:hypothetical protein BDZ91DRAFT_732758 [Kalaharituber pfeilii]
MTTNAPPTSKGPLNRTVDKSPGWNAVPFPPVITMPGGGTKTVATARKTASNAIGTSSISGFDASSYTTMKQKSKSRGSLTSEERMSPSTTLNKPNQSPAEKLRKRKRIAPFAQSDDDDDDLVGSDLISDGAGYKQKHSVDVTPSSSRANASTDKQAKSDVPPMEQKAATALPNPTSLPISLPQKPGAAMVVVLDTENTAGASINATALSKHSNATLITSTAESWPNKKLKASHIATNTFSSNGNGPHEVITIDSDDEEGPSASTKVSAGSLALVERGGTANIISAFGNRDTSSLFPPSRSTFSQKVKAITAILKERAETGSSYASSDKAPSRELSNSAIGGMLDSQPSEVFIVDGENMGEFPSITRVEGDGESEGTGANEDEQESVNKPQGGVEKNVVTPETVVTEPRRDVLASNVQEDLAMENAEPAANTTSEEASRSGLNDSEAKYSANDSGSRPENPVADATTTRINAEENSVVDVQSHNRISTAQPTTGPVVRTSPVAHTSPMLHTGPVVHSGPLVQNHSEVGVTYLSAPPPVVVSGVRGCILKRFRDVEDKYAREFRLEARRWLHDRVYVDHEFFPKMYELAQMVARLERTVFLLYEEASQYIITHQFYQSLPEVILRGRIDDYFLHDRQKLQLRQRLNYLLKEITVMTFTHQKVMFEAWVVNGKKRLQGKVVLSTDSILDLVEAHKKVSAEIEQESMNAMQRRDQDHDMGEGLAVATSGISEDSRPENPPDTIVVASSSVEEPSAMQAQIPEPSQSPQSQKLQSQQEPQPQQQPQSSEPPQIQQTQPQQSQPAQSQQPLVTSQSQPTQLPETLAAREDKKTAPDPMVIDSGDGFDEGNRKNSLIVRIPAPTTVLRELNSSQLAQSSAPTASPARISTGNARSNLKKSMGASPYKSILNEMQYFGESRMQQMKTAAIERHDPYLHQIRELDREKDQIRHELRQLAEDASRKSQQYDYKLTNLLLEADFLDHRRKSEGLGLNGYLPPERDLEWEKYEKLAREKSVHEAEVALKRERLVRRGWAVHEEKKRAVQKYEENKKLEDELEALAAAKRRQLLMLSGAFPMNASRGSSTTDSTPSSREPSAAAAGNEVGTAPNRVGPNGENIISTSNSSGPSSVFSNDEVSISVASAPDVPTAGKPSMLEFAQALVDNVRCGYGEMLLAGIRDVALLPESDEPRPPKSKWLGGALDNPARKKKGRRTKKGW